MQANTVRADDRGQSGVLGWLRLELSDRKEKSIFRSEQQIIQRLIDRKLECKEAFDELVAKLECYQWQAYLLTLISTASIWNPSATSELREVKKKLLKLNESIADKADQLASEIKLRAELCGQYSFSTNDTYHIVDLLTLASTSNENYEGWIRERLEPLRGQFDPKYWPKIEDVVQAISRDAQEGRVTAADDITREAISSRKSSHRDFLRALSEAILNNSETYHAFIPNDFRLPGHSISTLANCALGLEENDCIDESDVKATRKSANGKLRL